MLSDVLSGVTKNPREDLQQELLEKYAVWQALNTTNISTPSNSSDSNIGKVTVQGMELSLERRTEKGLVELLHDTYGMSVR